MASIFPERRRKLKIRTPIILGKENCPDCDYLKQHLTNQGISFIYLIGDKFFDDVISGTVPMEKSEVVDLMTVMKMQDDTFPVFITQEGAFFGKALLEKFFGIQFPSGNQDEKEE